MKKVILKYGITPSGFAFNQEFQVALRDGAVPIAAQVQEHEKEFFQVWCLCTDEAKPVVFYKFLVANTGSPFELPDGMTYLGTIQRGALVGHVFYAAPEAA